MTATIRYMGSKRSLAPTIASLITQRHPASAVADAFAGTCAIGTAVARHHPLFANDIHAFAGVIARSLFVAPARRPTVARATREISEAFRVNMDALRLASSERLNRESVLLAEIQRPDGWVRLRDFTIEELAHPVPRALPGLPSVDEYRAEPTKAPYALCSMYFASAYFGVSQSAEIDSLRFAIAQAPAEHQDHYLLALLQAMSHCAATPGHFAQHLVPRDARNTKYIARIRGRSVYRRFISALAEMTIPSCHSREENRVFTLEAVDFIGALRAVTEHPVVVYADPPYSRAQYSRYYHVPETVVLYDYPGATGKGRYRGERFLTDFSRRGKVVGAMRRLVKATADMRAPLYLSYPKNGLLYQTGVDLLEILREHYPHARIASTTPLAHSTMGGAPGTAAIEVIEDVYYAGWND